MNKVWITQYRDDFDYTPAGEWGQIKVVTEMEVPVTFIGKGWKKFVSDVERFLSEVDTDHDYVLLSGNPVQMMVIAGSLASGGHTEVKSLKWLKRERKYIPIVVPLQVGFK